MSEPQATIEQRISAALGTEEAPPTEAPKAAPETAEAVPEAAPVVDTLLDTGEPAVEESSAETAEAAPEEAPAANVEVTEESAEEITISSLHELAEQTGIAPEDLYNLSFPITDPDGLKREVPIGQIKDDIQNAQAAKKLAEETQVKLETERQQLQQNAEAQAQQTAMFLQQAEQTLMQDFNSVDWDQLRASNPTEWAARRQELGERQGALQNIRQQAGQQYAQMQEQQQAAKQAEYSQHLARESAALVNSIPEWRTETVKNAEQAKLRDYLLDGGYSEQEIQSAADHRTIVLARKAMLYDQMKSKATAAKKKVVRVAKTVLKPGAKQGKAEQRQDAESALRARLKKTGNTDDAAALIQHRLGR